MGRHGLRLSPHKTLDNPLVYKIKVQTELVVKNTMIAINIDNRLDRFQNRIRYAFEYALSALGYSYLFVEHREQVGKNDVLILYGYTEPTSEELQQISSDYITIFIQCEPDLYDDSAYTAAKLKGNLRKVSLLSPPW